MKDRPGFRHVRSRRGRLSFAATAGISSVRCVPARRPKRSSTRHHVFQPIAPPAMQTLARRKASVDQRLQICWPDSLARSEQILLEHGQNEGLNESFRGEQMFTIASQKEKGFAHVDARSCTRAAMISSHDARSPFGYAGRAFGRSLRRRRPARQSHHDMCRIC